MTTTVAEAPTGRDDRLISELVAKDRCDNSNCGAQARYAVLIDGNVEPLMFCAHHSYAIEAKLSQYKILAIKDTRPALIAEERNRYVGQ